MELKRLFQRKKDGTNKLDKDGNLILTSEVEIRRMSKVWHPTPKVVEKGLSEGWMTVSRGVMTLHTPGEDVDFKIKRRPGYYCLFGCGEIESDPQGKQAREHVAELHNGEASPDPNWPTGYERINYYDVEAKS